MALAAVKAARCAQRDEQECSAPGTTVQSKAVAEMTGAVRHAARRRQDVASALVRRQKHDDNVAINQAARSGGPGMAAKLGLFFSFLAWIWSVRCRRLPHGAGRRLADQFFFFFFGFELYAVGGSPT